MRRDRTFRKLQLLCFAAAAAASADADARPPSHYGRVWPPVSAPVAAAVILTGSE